MNEQIQELTTINKDKDLKDKVSPQDLIKISAVVSQLISGTLEELKDANTPIVGYDLYKKLENYLDAVKELNSAIETHNSIISDY